MEGQWGLEKTYNEYLDRLFRLMDEIKRILKPTGTVWINLGDTYFGSGNDSGKKKNRLAQNIRSVKAGEIAPAKANNHPDNQLKKKSQVLIPHRFAVGCVDRSWIVRNDIIWAKPNGAPESVKDRFSKKHEHIFLFVKQPDYYFDLDSIRDPHKESSFARSEYLMTAYGGDPQNKKGGFGKGKKNGGALRKITLNPNGKNPGDVTDFWNISLRHGSEKHYATFNTALVQKPILAGCPIGGIVLDPFCGTGTTGVAAIELGRKFIGIEGKKQYCLLAKKNLRDALEKENTGALSGIGQMRTPISYYGGKQTMLKYILELIPPHHIYCEPFFGGGAVFFAKPKSEVEVINDINSEVVNFFKVVKTRFGELQKEIRSTPHSRELYKKAMVVYEHPDMFSDVKRAWALWTLTNQGFACLIGSWGFGKDSSKEKSLASKRVEFTKQYTQRLEKVQIENNHAIKVIDRCDAKETFIYCDPPYINSNQGHYAGYTEEEYKTLLEKLSKVKGKFLLSSYPSKILSQYIRKNRWKVKKVDKQVAVTKLTGKKKTEVLVMNYDPEKTGNVYRLSDKETKQVKSLTAQLDQLKFAA